MDSVFDISEVTRRTGLTSRALRFYEARGLVKPLRTASGRRHYGLAELERVNQIVALKRAGLTLAQIQLLTDRRPLDLAQLVDAQLDAVEAQANALAEAKALLLSVKSRIDHGEPVDVATLCSLIRQGDAVMEPENWKKVTDRYFTPDEKARWAEKLADLPSGWSQDDYAARWKDLGGRITAALPLDPASGEAQAFVTEWFALLAPFREIASPEMWSGANRMYDNMDQWEGKADPGFDSKVWAFMKLASVARLSDGVAA